MMRFGVHVEDKMAVPRVVALLFAVITQTTCLLTLDHTLSAGRQILAAAAILVLIFDTVWVYTRRRSIGLDVVLAGPLVVASAQAFAVPPVTVALALAVLAIHSFHGSNRQAVIRTINLALALPAVIVVSQLLGTPARDDRILAIIPIPVILLFSALMRSLHNSLQKQEEAAQRQTRLARSGRELLGVTDADTVREIVAAAASDLCQLTPGLELALADSAGPGKVLVVSGPPPVPEILNLVDTLAAQLSLAEASCEAHAEFARLSASAVVRANHDLKEALAAAGQARDQAVSANAAKSAFLATMSHELRTPMNAVLGLAELLHDTGLDAAQFDLLTTISSSADQLLTIINDILDFSKSEANELDLEYRPVDLRELVRESMSPLMSSAHGLDVDTVVENDCPAVIVTDPARLRQVIGHLVGNAIKFTNQGSVRIRVSCQESQQSQQDQDGGRLLAVRFDVQDSGIGISPDSHERLFQPFSQVDASNTRPFGGAGLGLVISRAIVRAMGGDIEVRSVPGEGSTFSFTVLAAAQPADGQHDPRAATARAPVPAPRFPEPAVLGAATQGTTSSLRILLAEDNEVNQKVARLMAGKLGHTVQVASNGQEALVAARAAAFDVILMDIHMPVMDGLQATRLIRAELPADHQPRIIAMTASVTREDRDACRTAGMDGFLAKPVRREDLGRALSGIGAEIS